ncbi:MAG: hypothetical protein V3S65_09730 [Candidatus Aminicenantaceae bacterium]
MADIQQFLGPNGLIYSLEDTEGNVDIIWGGKLYYYFNRENLFALNLGIALLDSIGVVQKTICQFFKISRNTITNVSKIYAEDGIEGLINYKHGAPAIEEELRFFVIKMFIELENTRGYQNKILKAVEKKVEHGEFRKSISRTTLHTIVREYKTEREEQKRKNIEERQTRETAEKNKKRIEGENKEEKEPDNGKIEFISDIAEGEEVCVEHGGAAAAAIFLDEYGMAENIPEEDEKENHYSNQELAVTFALLNAGEIVKVEQDFEQLPSYQMGGLIGKSKLPSLSLYRNRIPGMVEQMNMREVILETSKRMQEILEFSPVVYVDGHFMPYHGGSDTLYGYYPQKRLAMHGREYFFVHDTNRLPVYATISDGYRKMKHYIEDVDEKLREIYGRKEKELLEIFDRGGYSKEFCVGIANRIRFICWRSDARTVPRIAEWREVEVEHQGNSYGQVKKRTFYAWERDAEFKVEKKQAKFREVWIKKYNKVSPALTNDFELSLEEVVRALTRRWGSQENMFKELKDHGIDRIHSYRKQEYTEEFLYDQGLEDPEKGIIREIDNPEIRLINKKLSSLRDEKRKMAEKILELEKRGEKNKLVGIRRKYSGIERRIKNQIERRESLPKKINLFNRIKENDIVRLSDEKKLFFDWLKMNAIWAKREIIEIVKPYYHNLRDVNKFVKSILTGRTYVRRKDDVLYIDFPYQKSQKRHEALTQLCKYLNSHGEIDLGFDYHLFIFGIQEIH